jgi:hypothetical protein
MSDTTCPHCGGPIAVDSAACEYCGSVISSASGAVMKWTRVDRHLPPPDPTHPGRSISVIVLDLGDDLTYVNKKDKKTYYWYENFDYLLISAYYDFGKKDWMNDIYGKRLSKKFSPLIAPTHWMSIPPKGSAAWISIKDKYPPEVSTPDTTYKEGIRINPTKILACKQDADFMQSVIMAVFYPPPSTKQWECYDLDGDGKVDDNTSIGEMISWHGLPEMTHWMFKPPVGPTE